MGRKNRKGRTRNMGRGKQIRTTLANDILIQQNAAEDTQQDANLTDTEQMDEAIRETVDITAEKYEGLAEQTFEILPLDRLFLETYQRTLNPQKVKRIVREFDPSKLGVLMISERPDGRYAVIDGQHRMTALREMGYDAARDGFETTLRGERSNIEAVRHERDALLTENENLKMELSQESYTESDWFSK